MLEQTLAEEAAVQVSQMEIINLLLELEDLALLLSDI
jgi:hypothetical protein